MEVGMIFKPPYNFDYPTVLISQKRPALLEAEPGLTGKDVIKKLSKMW
jgi:hypothetical protein